VKPLLALGVICSLVGVLAGCSAYRSVSHGQLRFLDTQEQPLWLPDVTKRLGHTEIGEGPYYAYTLKGQKTTIEFWMLPPPETMPAEGVAAEIGMVVERPSDSPATIIWPAALKGSDVEAAKKRFYPKMYSWHTKRSNSR
jgi:hypothetical protein